MRDLGTGLGSGRGATAAIHIAFWTSVPRDLANVSVNDDFRFVVRLFALVGISWLIGFWCPCHALLQLIKRPFVDRLADNVRAND